eukprot:gene17953-20449_t
MPVSWSTNTLSSTSSEIKGFYVEGFEQQDFMGRTVSSAGDINGDGYAEVIIGGTPRSNIDVFVTYGCATASFSNIVLPSSWFTVLSTKGFALNSDGGGTTAYFAVSGGKDINDDGVADMIVGSSGYGTNDAGRTCVIYGLTNNAQHTTNGVFNLDSMSATSGFCVKGGDDNDLSGAAVKSVGDINGDGIGDFIVGAPQYDGVSSNDNFGAAAMPTKVPTRSPTFQPTSSAPTAKPTLIPSPGPSRAPSCAPSAVPSRGPTQNPSFNPTAGPTFNPSKAPSLQPSLNPTAGPSAAPTMPPSVTPTADPSRIPTASPSTASPSVSPSAGPSANPTKAPTFSPSTSPSAGPSAGPTKGPTLSPSVSPSASPS